ncbi:hypothetical protein ACIRST_29115 [Kitasatospora sp. NPDC101447]|uniref:hypothetical protein n=1 Tax=Kitasatospora sp. NPDC101447 TaxID=3364102 RepID=UPI003815A304
MSLVAVQVKSAAAGREISASRALEVLVHLVATYESHRYELITNAAPETSCSRLAEVLSRHGHSFDVLRVELESILVRAPTALGRLRALTPEQWTRLGRARITFDPRDDTELREDLNGELRQQRAQGGRGLSHRSGSLVMGFLVAEVLRRAADATQAYWPVEDFRRRLLVDDDVLCEALGRQDFGIVLGPVPNVPDIAQPELLDKVSAVLSGPDNDVNMVPMCVISGLSGIGKSSLAAAYIAREAFRYDLIFWMDAATEEALTASYGRLLAHLTGLSDVPEVGDPVLVRERVQALLQELPGPWLLVFDDAVPGTVARWIPRRGRGRVLATSVSRTWRGVQGRVEVGPMTPEHALLLLTLRLELNQQQAHLHQAALIDLVDALDCWPLAIELAAGYLVTCEVDLDRLDGYRTTLLTAALDDQLSVPLGYPRTLVAAVLLSVNRLRGNARGRMELLHQTFQVLGVLCFLAPHRAPVHLAVACAFVSPDDVPNGIARALIHEEDSPAREIIRELAGVSFVRYTEPLPSREAVFAGCDDTVSMNAVLQSILRQQFEISTDLQHVLPETAYHTDRWLAEAMNSGESERAWELAQHASALLGHIERVQAIHNHTALLAGNLAGFHGNHGQYATAIRLLQLELGYLEQCGEPDLLLRAQARVQLSNLYQLTALDGSSDRIVEQLGELLPYVAGVAGDAPSAAGTLATEAFLILQMESRRAADHEGLRRLLAQFRQLVSRLPRTEKTQTMQAAVAAGDLIQEGRADEAEKAAEAALALGDNLWAPTVAEARRLLIEALVAQEKWEEADAEFTRFLPYAGARTLYGFSVSHLLHNAGSRCALSWVLTEEQAPLELLIRLINDIGLDLADLATDNFDRARFILLRTVCAASRAAVAPSQSDEFMELLQQLTEMTFADDPVQARLWETIYEGLLPRMSAIAASTIHAEAQAGGDAILSSALDQGAEATVAVEKALIEVGTHVRLMLSTDPSLSSFNFGSTVDLLSPGGQWFPGPMPIVLLQPERLVVATSPITGKSIEVQLHRTCAYGFRRLLGPHLTIPCPEGLTLEQDGPALVLHDAEGFVLARASAVVPLKWREAAIRRGRALVLYGFAFALDTPAISRRIFTSSMAVYQSVEQAADKGLIAAAAVSVKLSTTVPTQRRQQRRTTRSSRRRR